MEQLSNGKFISKYHTGISCRDIDTVLKSLTKNIPTSSVGNMCVEENTKFACGEATIFHIPLKYNTAIERDEYNNRIKFSSPMPEIEIIFTNETGQVSETDPTEQQQLQCDVLFVGCKICTYRHRNWETYTNNCHFGYKFKIEDLLSYDILPCIRIFNKCFSKLLDPINSDTISND